MRTHSRLRQLAHRKGYLLDSTHYTVSLWTLRQRRWPGSEYHPKHLDGSEVTQGPASTSPKDVRAWLLAQPDARDTVHHEELTRKQRVKWTYGSL